jgi:hypothetical protein
VQRLFRYASWLCAAIALILSLALAGSAARMDTGSLYFLPDQQRFKEPLKEAQVYNITLTLRNGTRHNVSLLGAPGFCGPGGCAALSGFPQTLKPNMEARIAVEFTAGLPGAFFHEIPVYTNHPRQPQVMLRFTGEVLDTKPVAVSTSSETSKPVHW